MVTISADYWLILCIIDYWLASCSSTVISGRYLLHSAWFSGCPDDSLHYSYFLLTLLADKLPVSWYHWPSFSDHNPHLLSASHGICTFSQCHCRYTIVLWYDNISFMANTDQFIIYCICSCPYYNHFAIIRIQNMIRITQQCSWNIIFLCYCLNNTYYRTCICIYKYLH